MAFEKAPGRRWVLGALTIVFVAVAALSSLEKALAAATTIGVFGAIIQEKWGSRTDFRLWLVLGISAIVHAAFIIFVRFPAPKVGLVSLPFAFLDAFLILGLINWLERRYPRVGS